MNVRELIELLQKRDRDLSVYVRGYEDGVDDVGAAEEIKVRRDVYVDTWYYGDHEVITYPEDADGPLAAGLLLTTGPEPSDRED